MAVVGTKEMTEKVDTHNPWIARYLAAYLLALLAAFIFSGLMHTDFYTHDLGPYSILAAGSFPRGLTAFLVPYSSHPAMWTFVTNALYLCVLYFGVRTRSRVLFIVFVGLLLLNIAGCSTHDYSHR